MVFMDSNGDRNPIYWLYQFREPMEEFSFWTEVQMNKPEGEVRSLGSACAVDRYVQL